MVRLRVYLSLFLSLWRSLARRRRENTIFSHDLELTVRLESIKEKNHLKEVKITSEAVPNQKLYKVARSKNRRRRAKTGGPNFALGLF